MRQSSKKELLKRIVEEVGISERHARRFLEGYKTQKYTIAKKVAEVLGVPVETFLAPEQRREKLKVPRTLLNVFTKVVEKHTAKKVASWIFAKEGTIYQMKGGYRLDPLTQALLFLEGLKKEDAKLYTETLQKFIREVGEMDVLEALEKCKKEREV